MPSTADRMRTATVLASALVAAFAAQARAAARAEKVVRYHGYTLTVPRSWPVFDLARSPHTCVRFDRHAVYLGAPGADQRCAPHAVGRTEAILVEPLAASTARAGTASEPVALAGAGARLAVRAHGVVVTTTWGRDRALVAHALGRRTLSATRAALSATLSATRAVGGAGPRARASVAASRAHTAAAVYTGLGFDACSAPSLSAMSAWKASPYRAIGIYIGGANSACSQPNLTAAWVSTQVAAGWHLILTYVGLQAPGNSCSCAAITPSQATAQGTAAANDAVSDAQALAIPTGNPIYFDMEAYNRTASATSAVLTFLSAWTKQLHALGYLSGVYSSSASGIADLVAANGTAFTEPDDIWFAEWNNAKSTTTSYIPAAQWPSHQRIHQYTGDSTERYGGVSIDIDHDMVDAATADTSGGSLPPVTPTGPPSLSVSAGSDGMTRLSASWSGATGVAAWRVLAGTSAGTLTSVTQAPASGAATQIVFRSAAPYFAVQALGSAGQVLGSSATMQAPAHLLVFGRSAFVPAAGGLGGLPIGCYTGSPCAVTATVTAGRTVIARTGGERFGPNATGIQYFQLTSNGRTLLGKARNRRLPVDVALRDSSGTSTTARINLIPFTSSGRVSTRQVAQPPAPRIVGLTDFVSPAGVGGILAGCPGAQSCSASTTIRVGRTVVARTGPEWLGANELGYLIFSLTARGRTLLAHARGNRLGAQVTVATADAKAVANIALVQFH